MTNNSELLLIKKTTCSVRLTLLKKFEVGHLTSGITNNA